MHRFMRFGLYQLLFSPGFCLILAIFFKNQIEGQNYFTSADFTALASIQNAVIIGTCEVLSGTCACAAVL